MLLSLITHQLLSEVILPIGVIAWFVRRFTLSNFCALFTKFYGIITTQRNFR